MAEQKERAEELKKIIHAFEGQNILLVGDSGIDEYVWGQVRRISPEAPVPVLEADEESQSLGLAANVAHNVRSLQGEAQMISVVGEDRGAENFCQMLQSSGISSEYLLRLKDRPTTRKIRVMARTWRLDVNHMLRIDYEERNPLNQAEEELICAAIDQHVAQANAVVLQDYAKGLITERVARHVIDSGKKWKVPVLVDPHRQTPAHYYRGAPLFKPNYEEALALADLSFRHGQNESDLIESLGQNLRQNLELEQLIITRGRQGMSLFAGNRHAHVPTYTREVSDVTGAGDTVIATLALALATGADLLAACQIANFAAGVVVSQSGSVACHKQQLLDYIDKHSDVLAPSKRE